MATNAEADLIDAALQWALCPDAGGYWDGPSVEDGCERLEMAVRLYLGVSNLPNERRSKGGKWWSLAQTRRWTAKCLARRALPTRLNDAP